jgi:hypothetical protein
MIVPTERRRWCAWLAVLVLAVTAACGGGTPVPDPVSRPASRATPAPRPAALAALDVAGEDGIRLEIVSATRPTAGVVELRLALVNDGASAFDLGSRWAASADDLGAISDLALSEPDGQKRHFVLRDDQGRPLCSTGEAPIEAGERRELWARFGAPGASVSTMRLVAGTAETEEFAIPPVP